MTETTRIEGSGIELNVRAVGEGPAVLFLHGFPDSSLLWRDQMTALADAGFHAIAPDMRGYGESDAPENVEDYALMNVFGDIDAVLAHFEIEKAHLVGHDWGSGAAWVYTSLAPHRVLSLTALSVGHPAALRSVSTDQLQKSWYMFMFLFEGVAERWLSQNDWEFARTWTGGPPDIDKNIADLSRPGRLTAALNWYRANLRPDAWISGPPALPPIAVPTMGIWSTEDMALGEDQMLASQKYVQGPWRYERIENVGHWIPTQAPDQLNALLLDFLRSA